MSRGVIAALIAITTSSWVIPQIHSASVDDYKISNPKTLKNLSIYLIQSPDRNKGATYYTLKEGMEKNILKVHETGSVNELLVENTSPNISIYIEAGEIVKGGKQDRALGMDAIIPPRSGKMPIESFCVEQGRWEQRGSENARAFESSTDQVSSKDLKKAVRYEKDQGKVWNKVTETQNKLNSTVKSDVRSGTSASSLQLTLENTRVQESVGDFIKQFSSLTEKVKDSRGVAFAINGKITSVDIYADHALFTKIWPKLLKSAAVEAVSDTLPGTPANPPPASAVSEYLKKAESAPKTKEQDVNRKTKTMYKENAESLGNTTKDSADKTSDGYLHKNYLSK